MKFDDRPSDPSLGRFSCTHDTIGPGSTSTLTFTITNDDPDNPVSELAFTDNLPTGVTIADPANASTDCWTFMLK